MSMKEDKAAVERSKQIDARLEIDARNAARHIKLLLLGKYNDYWLTLCSHVLCSFVASIYCLISQNVLQILESRLIWQWLCFVAMVWFWYLYLSYCATLWDIILFVRCWWIW